MPASYNREMDRHGRCATVYATVLFIWCCAVQALPAEIRPSVWASTSISNLPIPTAGYQAYLIGELHGIQQNEDFQLRYLALLIRKTRLRDVAFEEKSVYESAAQAYVAGRSPALPRELCLRAPLLQRIRRLNLHLAKSRRLRIHFVDLDSPAVAIREHLLEIRERLRGTSDVAIPAAGEIGTHGLSAVEQLSGLHADSRTRSELRTVDHSIRALQQGFEVGVGPGKGSPYLEDREEAVASNVADLLHGTNSPLLVIYGYDHVSRSMRNDGGPNRDQPFAPMALRLQRLGIRTFSLVVFPLRGRYFWRGRAGELPYTARDGQLESGETLDRVVASAPRAAYVYVDPRRQKIMLPSSDVSKYAVDAFLLVPVATPVANPCPTEKATASRGNVRGVSPVTG